VNRRLFQDIIIIIIIIIITTIIKKKLCEYQWKVSYFEFGN